MSQVNVFSLLGDSNIHRHVNKNTCRANPLVKASQIIPCGHIELLAESLASVRDESNCSIISCMSNFIADAPGPPWVSQRVQPVLQAVLATLEDFCESHPEVNVLVSPPMYRTAPVWYREGLPEILTLFSQIFTQASSEKLLLLPSFATPDYESDGVHLTPYSGLEFIMHLFDSASALLMLAASPVEAKGAIVQESARVLEDRVMVLEQDHRRLNRVVEKMSASEAELSDFRTNERFEDSFVIIGLAAISPEIVGKPWQIQAVKDVQEVLVLLMGKELPIVVVQNATKRHRGAEVTYNVRMSDIGTSSSIRKKFGSFFLGSQDKRPPALKHVNIKNRVTPDTRIRVDVLKLLAKKYRDSNPGSKVQVVSYDPRPLIKITPSSSASDRRVQVMNYVEAVRRLPSNFTEDEVAPILRRINPNLAGSVRSIFVILSDDMFRDQLAKFKNRSDAPPSAEADAIDIDPAAVQAVATVPVPPPAPFVPVRSRNQKRGASSALGSSAKK